MNAAMILQVCLAALLLAVGVMLAVVSSLVPGLILTAAASWWLVRSARRL